MPLSGDLLVQYGCGWCAPAAWQNFDASPTLRFERLPLLGSLYTRNAERFPPNVRYGDIVRGLPLPTASCRAIYCSHVLEHLALDELVRALAETRRLLAPGGRFRLVVPDLEVEIRRYVEQPGAGAAEAFLRRTELGWPRRPRGLKGFVREWLGNYRHRWMWDYAGLSAELARAGFHDVRRAAFGDSGDAAFAAVEDPGRWRDALGIDCRG